jgi:hypothetical protein
VLKSCDQNHQTFDRNTSPSLKGHRETNLSGTTDSVESPIKNKDENLTVLSMENPLRDVHLSVLNTNVLQQDFGSSNEYISG